ncbi:hypothetical protein [Streptomyces violascens]|uniref:hypothetical protein n=1 Tax=Streptomyces violascens TaxID=67381 RepID=UPI00364C1D6C
MTKPQVSDASELVPGTAEELVHDARTFGVEDASSRMITDWVEVGLLGPAGFRKTTQHGSDPRLFPACQRRLFHGLLTVRQRSPLKRVPHHTMVPLVLLVWLTSDGIVCEEQAARALCTHARATGKRTKTQRQEDARKIVDRWAYADATYRHRRTAQLLLVEAATTRRPDWDKIHSALTAVSSLPRTEGVPLLERGIGLPESPMRVTDAVVMWAAQQRVTALLAQGHRAVDTADLLEARAHHRRDWASYEESREAMEPRSTTPGFFARPHDAEGQVREQVAAYVDQLAGVLGIIGQVAAEARAAGVPRDTPDGRIARLQAVHPDQ